MESALDQFDEGSYQFLKNVIWQGVAAPQALDMKKQLSVRHELVPFNPSLMPQKPLNKSIVTIGGPSGMGLSAAVAWKEAGAQLVVVGRDGGWSISEGQIPSFDQKG